VLEQVAFISGDTHTHFIADHFPAWTGRERHRVIAAIAAAIDATRRQQPASAAPHNTGSASPWTMLGHWRLGQND
jgi:hypothetical protein